MEFGKSVLVVYVFVTQQVSNRSVLGSSYFVS